jgi:hypothetical protein
VAGQVNKTLPKTLDEETELLETVGLEGTLVYYYRLLKYSAAELGPQKLDAALRPNLTRSACSTPQTRDGLLKHGVTFKRWSAAVDLGVRRLPVRKTPGASDLRRQPFGRSWGWRCRCPFSSGFQIPTSRRPRA